MFREYGTVLILFNRPAKKCAPIPLNLVRVGEDSYWPETAVHEGVGGDILHLDQGVHHWQLVVEAKQKKIL